MSEIADLEDTAEWRRMGRAIRFLSEHYLDQPRLEDAAAAAGLSPFHFQRLFTRYVGVSPKAFVGHLTLGHAKRELARGASVLEAALEAGLSGPSRLHDLCLKIEAMTPGDYAKAGRGVAIVFMPVRSVRRWCWRRTRASAASASPTKVRKRRCSPT
jgi:AraC family transcriptional regulator of adaptative response/methylated-DNA-[protein]-cysteine methyltransferase